MSQPQQSVSQRSERPKGTGSGEPQSAKKSRSALVRSIADALVIKDQDVFFLCDREGQLPLQGPHGYGLYYHDCRFLSGYELRLAGQKLSRLVATAGAGFKAELELTNPDVQLDGGQQMPKEDLAIRWERMIDSSHLSLQDLFTFQNFGVESFTIPVSLHFAADFADVFVVRGMLAQVRGTREPPRWDNGQLVFAYHGSDGLWRGLTIKFDPTPTRTEETTAHLNLKLAPHEKKCLGISLILTESSSKEKPLPAQGGQNLPQLEHVLHQGSHEWMQRQTRCHSDHVLFNHVLRRSLLDLHILRSRLNGFEYFAAGVPWYVTLFGRDSLIAALESLAFQPDIAEQTLRLLARYQGTKIDDWRDEQPGKILHELRVGELAHQNEIPQTPYYGSVDATPLFLILLGLHARWTGSLQLFQDLQDNIERALEWITKYGDLAGNGYLSYQCNSSKGLSNQGWKDSGDAISNEDGSLARSPIALAEVQGYVYLAKILLTDLYRRADHAARADSLQQEAQQLRERFNHNFWLEDKGCYAVALQGGGRPAATVTSNAGQVLWSGIADADKAKRTADRLMAEDMYSGWGIRTLSENEQRYNPIGYHLGTVWPHDNALIAAGFRRYGFHEAAERVCGGIIEAAISFSNNRLPEVFAGLRRRVFGLPVHYPVACHPQAWAAGAVPYMLTALLGLEPRGFEGQLHVVRPLLPAGCEHLQLQGLRVGSASVDLRFTRLASGKVGMEVLSLQGDLEVVMQE